jgi:prepilin-type processing-associated H-X9-DG protein
MTLSDAAHHRFRIDNIAQPALKSAALDGSRYVDDSGRISFNVNGAGAQYGLNFTNRGPTLNANTAANGNPYTYSGTPDRLHPRAARYTYRHPGDSINISFHDGHAANFDSVESRRVDFYYPAGAVVQNPARIGDPGVYRGYVVR